MHVTYMKQQLNAILDYRGCDVTPYYRQARPLIMKQANELVEHIFTFDKPWDMERCTTPYQLPPIIDWNITPHDDEEWTFMLNRMDYLSYLLQAYALDKQDIFLKTCKDLILQWIQAHPSLLPSPSTRTLDSAIRISNMMDAVTYLYHYDVLSDEELDKIATYFDMQIQTLYDQYIPKYTLSNWGSIQTCVIICLLPILHKDYHEHKLFQWAKQELTRQVDIQIYEDGMSWEQSTMYHIEVLNYLMKTIFISNIFPLDISETITEKAYALCDSIALQSTPNNEIEAFGDSDRCSIKDIFTRATYLFQAPLYKHLASTSFDIESTYCFGSHAAQTFQQMPREDENRLYYDGVDSGMYTVRSSWQKDASYTMFTNGSLGSGHGHCDNLHVSLYFKGKPFLIDTGRYTYKEQDTLRPYLKSMAAHNSVIIDQTPHSIPKGSWDYEQFGKIQKTYVKHDGMIHYLEGSMINTVATGIHIRKLMIIDPCIWLICDEIHMQGNHTVTQTFHLDPMVELNHDKGIRFMQGDNILCADFHQVPESHQEPCSLRYNELLDHMVVQVQDSFCDTHTMFTSFYDTAISRIPMDVYQDDKIASHELVDAYKYIVSKTESYIIILFHSEIYLGRKICFCDGVAFHAKSVVIHQLADKTTIHRLKC